jgi:putative phosphotransacetylase
MPDSQKELIETICEMVLRELGRGELRSPAISARTLTPPGSPGAAKPGSASGATTARGIMIPVGVSHRHIHIQREHLDQLYGRGHDLTIRNELTQPGEFAAKETVTLVGPKLRALENVRILGPVRQQTQIELAKTDAIYLGLDPPVRESGQLAGSDGATLVGPKGTVILQQGIIRANRHIHMTPEDARRLGVEHRQIVKVKVEKTDKPLILLEVMIRVSTNAYLELHVDTDDANAANLTAGDLVELLL